MKKLLLIITLAAMTGAMASGKGRRTLHIMQSSVPETETIDMGTTEFVYDYRYCVDTIDSVSDQFATDNMLLQIGQGGLSKFSSYKNLTVDSIVASCSWEQLKAVASANPAAVRNGEFMTIYKNYPEGRLTHTEKICQDWLSYEEEMPRIEWELTDSVATVLGYECKSARCNFRGREWTVLYTEEIPIADGPWKLHGLPGLIMKATDGGNQYSFECIGIKSRSDRPITIYKVPYNTVDRKGYYDTKHRYDVNPFAYFETTTGGHITVRDMDGNVRLDEHDPVELPYDYIERDWRK